MKSVLERNLKTLLEEGREAELAEMLDGMHPADVAEILNPLDMDDTIKVMSLMDIEQAADVLVEMTESSRDQVAAEMPLEKLTELVAEMESDDAADIVAELSDEEANKVLAAIDQEDADDVRRLMLYDEETAGGLMQVEMVTAREEETVGDLVDRIRKLEDSAEVYYIFVVDQAGILRGQVTIRQLLLAWPDQAMSTLMSTPPLVVRVDEDQEQVAQKFQKYDVQAAPVIDDRGRLLGRITFDDIMDVVHEEMDQDFYRLAGSSEEEVYSSGPAKIATLRLPWLLFNLGGGFITSAILTYFEVSFSNILVLVPFVPMIMGLSGAVGSQSATITVRGLAMGRITEGKIWLNILREIRISSIIAATLGTIIALGSGLIHSAVRLGAAVGVSIVTAIVVSTALGAVIPLFFKAMKIDPALASGPVVTSTNDVVSLIIYMCIGTAILGW
ncbi:magnesium transporter [Deltaproteobacteria bacterium OttesenSCG-928-M10]|nr:magnesium transporter [Deltaproteobacteria bacterium OttesenSCG-928-M10]